MRRRYVYPRTWNPYKFTKLCEARGYRNVDLARWLGCSSGAISTWRNLRNGPGPILFPRLAEVMGMSEEELMRRCCNEPGMDY